MLLCITNIDVERCYKGYCRYIFFVQAYYKPYFYTKTIVIDILNEAHLWHFLSISQVDPNRLKFFKKAEILQNDGVCIVEVCIEDNFDTHSCG